MKLFRIYMRKIQLTNPFWHATIHLNPLLANYGIGSSCNCWNFPICTILPILKWITSGSHNNKATLIKRATRRRRRWKPISIISPWHWNWCCCCCSWPRNIFIFINTGTRVQRILHSSFRVPEPDPMHWRLQLRVHRQVWINKALSCCCVCYHKSSPA